MSRLSPGGKVTATDVRLLPPPPVLLAVVQQPHGVDGSVGAGAGPERPAAPAHPLLLLGRPGSVPDPGPRDLDGPLFGSTGGPFRSADAERGLRWVLGSRHRPARAPDLDRAD